MSASPYSLGSSNPMSDRMSDHNPTVQRVGLPRFSHARHPAGPGKAQELKTEDVTSRLPIECRMRVLLHSHRQDPAFVYSAYRKSTVQIGAEAYPSEKYVRNELKH